MVTTRGRLLRGFTVEFRDRELHVAWVRLEPGEEVAVLIDRTNNVARLCRPLPECRELALRHGYELVMPRKEGESLVEHIERSLGLRNTAAPNEASDRAGHGRGSVAHATDCPESGGGSPAVQVESGPAFPGAGPEAARQGAWGAEE